MITFGIITNKGHHKTSQHQRLTRMLESITTQNIPEYEVIIVGDYYVHAPNVKCVAFDDSIKPGWISRKKNIITQEAKSNVVVYMHDYVCLDKDWWEGWQNFGWDWDIAMNVILNKDGTRFRDWCVFQYDGNKGRNGIWPCNLSKCPNIFLSPYLPDYSYNRTENLYISGTYWLAKRQVMLDEPLDEEFVWGQHEDIEWSFRVLPKYKYVMNTQSHVHLLHQKDPVWSTLQ